MNIIPINDANQLINQISYDYLRNLNVFTNKLQPEQLPDGEGKKLLLAIKDLCNINHYSSNHPYLNDYRDALLALQTIVLRQKNSLPLSHQKIIDNLVIAVYENNNQALETSNSWIRYTLQINNLQLSDKSIKQQLRDLAQKTTSKLNNYNDPVKNDATLGAMNSLFGSYFQPMLSGSIPTVRHYNYKSQGLHVPRELRFGTQIEVVNNQVRINPLFQAYLDAVKNKKEASAGYTHIYFNALRRGGGTIERRREGTFTAALTDLENHHNNIAVITLPADGGLIALDQIHHNQKSLDLALVIAEIKQVAMNNGQDFYISDNVRKSANLSEDVINKLLKDSLASLGLQARAQQNSLSPAERHALMFHFTKFALTNHLIKQLSPQYINFTCKDAIDRGGVHSLYFNLLKSIELGTPLSINEFMTGLHAAPLYVKGRGMNHHSEMIWNALDKYINANQHKHTIPSWLIAWRDLNATTLNLQNYNEDKAKNNRVHRDLDYIPPKNLIEIILQITRPFANLIFKIISWFASCYELRHAASEKYSLSTYPDTKDQQVGKSQRIVTSYFNHVRTGSDLDNSHDSDASNTSQRPEFKLI